MKCEVALRYLSPYLDSELDGGTSFEISRHLEACEECRRRFEAERKLERTLASSFDVPGAEEIWRRISPFPPRRPWPILLASAAGLLAVLGLALAWFADKPGSELAALGFRSHSKFLEGQLEPTVLGSRVGDIAANLSAADLPLPPLLDLPESVWHPIGGRPCHLGNARVAFLMGHADGSTISVFIFSEKLLDEFPRTLEALKSGGILRATSGRWNCAIAVREGCCICVVGSADWDRLERIALGIVKGAS